MESSYVSTDSKKVLGNMNDLVAQSQYVIMSAGGVSCCDIGETILQVNRMPQKNLG